MALEAHSTFEGTENRSHSSVERCETLLTDPSLQWLSRCVGQSGTQDSTWGHTTASCNLGIITFLPIQARTWGGCSPSSPESKGRREPAALHGREPVRQSTGQTQERESGRTPQVLSKSLPHSHKFSQLVLGTLSAGEPEVVLRVKIQSAKSLAPQARRWFSHLENEDYGEADKKTQPGGHRNINYASPDPCKEWIISEILLWCFFLKTDF